MTASAARLRGIVARLAQAHGAVAMCRAGAPLFARVARPGGGWGPAAQWSAGSGASGSAGAHGSGGRGERGGARHWRPLESPLSSLLALVLGVGAGGVAACEKPVPNRALWEAAVRGDPFEVVARIDEGAQPDGFVDENGVSALIAAANQGHAEVVEVLLDAGADPDRQAPKGSSALMAASGEGHVHVVCLLLDGGANPDLLNKTGVSALIWACSKGNVDVVRVLLERGAKINHADHAGVTALMAASVLGHVEVVRLLLEHGARTDLVDRSARTALDFAQRKAVSKMEAKKTMQKEATARLLLEHGARGT